MTRSRSLWVGQGVARGLVLALFGVPIAAALPLALNDALSLPAWAALLQDPATPRSIGLSLASAVLSTGLALLCTMALVAALEGTPAWQRLSARLAPLLAMPHAAFAIGLAWLVSPTGEVARLLAAPLAWTSPPAWETVHDRHALMLTLALWAKELPFLLWNAVAMLSRPEVAAQLRGQRAFARSVGMAPASLWWRVLWPLWLPRLGWPLLAVLAYALTVVDLGLVIGPTGPPTLAVSAYADLLGGDAARNARGSAAALLLGGLMAVLVIVALVAWWGLRGVWLRLGTRGLPAGAGRRMPHARPWAAWGLHALSGVYAVVGATLLLLSLAGPWPFPERWPSLWRVEAWLQVAAAFDTVVFTAALAAAAAALALLLTMAWLEATPAHWDRWALPVVLAPLVVPGLLLMAGLYRGALHLALDGSLAGLLWGHGLVVLPYAFITLQPAWRSFDRRFEQTALALGRHRPAFWWRIKWPMLAAPLAAALAVGFAVSVAQFLATQFLGAGRFATVTTEAVTLASGGQRALAAAFALLQALLPLAAFLGASRLRWRPDA